MSVKYECDRCGKLGVAGDYSTVESVQENRDGHFFVAHNTSHFDRHFCQSCLAALHRFMQGGDAK